jgi:hypothetical protein
MALDLGKLGITTKGDYVEGTAYEKNDVVTLTDGNVYIAIADNTGVSPETSIGVNWNLLVEGLTTAEHAIFTGLAAGTAATLAPASTVLVILDLDMIIKYF